MPPQERMIHESAVIDPGAEIGYGSQIWHFCHVSSTSKIGPNCSLGQNVFVASNVSIGAGCKIQNNVSLYTGTNLEQDVFLGPSCVFTNVLNPRSEVHRHAFFDQTIVRRGATIGANATILCGVEIGRYAFVAAGAVVTKNVPDYGLIRGSAAEQVGWMSRHGHPLHFNDKDEAKCPESGFRYAKAEALVRCLDLPEEDAMPPEFKKAIQAYRKT
ncbi:MAG: acyltransferase [Planctomycetota bacterium]